MRNKLESKNLLKNVEIIKLEIDTKEYPAKGDVLEIAEKITQLENKIFKESSYTKEQITEMLNNNSYSVYIALQDKKEIISYMVTLDSIDVEEIIKIGTLEEYRGTGVSGKVFEKLILSDVKNIILEVRESNIQGIKFYEKNGLKIISKRKNYYADNNETALIMFLERVITNN